MREDYEHIEKGRTTNKGAMAGCLVLMLMIPVATLIAKKLGWILQ